MKIGILGSGRVGQALGKNWLSRGHEVMFSVRDPNGEKAQALQADVGEQVKMGNVRETAVFGDLLLLAVPTNAVEDVLQQAGNLTGKVLMDAVNRIPEPFPTISLAEEIHRLGTGAKVVKAFNTTGAENMTGRLYGNLRVDTYICGDDVDAKAKVRQLAEGSGFDVIDVGPLANAIMLENLARLWVYLAMRSGYGRSIAFKLLKQ